MDNNSQNPYVDCSELAKDINRENTNMNCSELATKYKAYIEHRKSINLNNDQNKLVPTVKTNDISEFMKYINLEPLYTYNSKIIYFSQRIGLPLNTQCTTSDFTILC